MAKQRALEVVNQFIDKLNDEADGKPSFFLERTANRIGVDDLHLLTLRGLHVAECAAVLGQHESLTLSALHIVVLRDATQPEDLPTVSLMRAGLKVWEDRTPDTNSMKAVYTGAVAEFDERIAALEKRKEKAVRRKAYLQRQERFSRPGESSGSGVSSERRAGPARRDPPPLGDDRESG